MVVVLKMLRDQDIVHTKIPTTTKYKIKIQISVRDFAHLLWKIYLNEYKKTKYMSNNSLLFNTINIFKSDRICPPIKIAHLSPRANTTLGQNSFLYKTIPDWNHLSPAAIESRSIAAFKSQLSDKSGRRLSTIPLPDTPLRRTVKSNI